MAIRFLAIRLPGVGDVHKDLIFIFNVETICLEVTGLESNSEIS